MVLWSLGGHWAGYKEFLNLRILMVLDEERKLFKGEEKGFYQSNFIFKKKNLNKTQ